MLNFQKPETYNYPVSFNSIQSRVFLCTFFNFSPYVINFIDIEAKKLFFDELIDEGILSVLNFSFSTLGQVPQNLFNQHLSDRIGVFLLVLLAESVQIALTNEFNDLPIG